MTKTLVGCLGLLALAAGCASGPVSKKDKKVTVVERERMPGTTLNADDQFMCENAEKSGSGVRAGVCQNNKQRGMEKESGMDALRRASQKAAPNR